MTDDDTRVKCADCANYRAGRCHKPQAAGLQPDKYSPGTAEVGRDLANTPQNCSAFKAAK